MSATAVGQAFDASRAQFEQIVGWLAGEDAAGMTHDELERHLDLQGRELLRRLLQDHLDLRAHQECRLAEVADDAGVPRTTIEPSVRALATVFGCVQVRRLAYRRRSHANLHPADAGLNLPAGRHSHGLRHLAAIEASRGSFDAAQDAIARGCGQSMGKRQVEALAQAAAVDFDAFYAHHQPPPASVDDVLVISCDGKGIVMRPDALRPATAKAAQASSSKLASRLSKGEKRCRKRMAEVGAVYDIRPVARSPDDIMNRNDRPEDRPSAPQASGKWLTASVVDDAAEVITHVFDEALRRDPDQQRTWVALVDGNNHQIATIRNQADSRNLTVYVLIDFIHVLEYLWAAAWSFFDEADPAAEAWVADKATLVLEGKALQVATGIRRRATRNRLDRSRRRNADKAATYLTNKAEYLDYPTALTRGWPIATGIIEGACRHLVKDRMDLTGARWGLHGAEAILKLRALQSNGDFNDYFQFHLAQEHQRNHRSRYADHSIPQAA